MDGTRMRASLHKRWTPGPKLARAALGAFEPIALTNSAYARFCLRPSVIEIAPEPEQLTQPTRSPVPGGVA